jgi:hypothetical protein
MRNNVETVWILRVECSVDAREQLRLTLPVRDGVLFAFNFGSREPASSTDLANNRGMQKEDHQFVITRNRNSLASGPLKYIKPASVLLLKVKFSRCQTLKQKAQVTGHRYGLEKYLGQDHRAAQIEPDSTRKLRDQGTECSEVGERRSAKAAPWSFSRTQMCHYQAVGLRLRWSVRQAQALDRELQRSRS